MVALLLFAAVHALSAPEPQASAASLSAATQQPSAAVSVHLDRTTVSTRIGQRFSFTSTLRNDSDQPIPGRIAHLNVLSLDPDVYVDPEDWSSSRTRYLGPLAAHGSARLAWTVQAVNAGRFVIYVALTAEQATDDVTASNALRLNVAQQRSINAGGVLPLVVAVPALVLLLMGLAARRRRRLRLPS